MSEFFISSWSGVVGNILFLGLLIVFAYLLQYLPRRKALRRFFLKDKSKIYIILSHVRVAHGGAIGVSGSRFSFASSAVPVIEAMVAQRFQGALLSPIPGLSKQPGLLGSLLISEFQVEVSPSPLSEQGIPKDGAIIAVGSGAFNSASLWIERDLRPGARFAMDNGGITLGSSATYTDAGIGFVTRVFDAENSRYVFYVAGPSEAATAASLQYLLENWRSLEERFRNRDAFAVAIRAISLSPVRGQMEASAE